MRRLAPVFLILLFVTLAGGCALTGAPAPETPREKYAAAEASYKAAVITVDQLVTVGTVGKGTTTAQALASSLGTARAALNAWGASPDSQSRQQAALTALSSLQRLLVELQRIRS